MAVLELIVKTAVDNAVKGLKAVGKGYDEIKSQIAGVSGVLGDVQALWDFSKQGAENQRIAASWKATASSFGQDADAMLAAIDRAAKGTVDDELIMQASTRAMALGTAQSGDQLVGVMELARASTKRFGGDAGEVYQGILQAIDNLQPRYLKQQGIIIDIEKVNAEYAKSLGKTKEELTEVEQREALRIAVMEKAKAVTAGLEGATEDAADRFAQLEVKIGNAGDALKEFAADTAMKAVDAGAQLVEMAQGYQNVLDEHNKTMLDTTSSYETYRAEMERSAGVAGRNAMTQQELNDRFEAGQLSLDDLKKAYVILSEQEFKSLKLGRELMQTTDEGTRLSHSLEAARQAEAKATEESARQERALETARKRSNDLVVGAHSLAIEYTQSERDLNEQLDQLRKIDEAIAANGPKRTAEVQNAKLSAEERAVAEARLAQSLVDLNGVQQKDGESIEDYNLRVATMKEKVADLSTQLGSHTAVLGGATKAQQENRDALIASIEAAQQAAEFDRARQVFDALIQSYQAGTLTYDQFTVRANALNDVSKLYTPTALAAALAHERLVATIADPSAENWEAVLNRSKEALDGNADAAAMLDKEAKAAQQAVSGVGKETETIGKNYARAGEEINNMVAAVDAANKKAQDSNVGATALIDEKAKAAQQAIGDVGKEAETVGKNYKLAAEEVDKTLDEIEEAGKKARTAIKNAHQAMAELEGKTVYIDIVERRSGSPDSGSRGTPGRGSDGRGAFGLAMVVPPGYSEPSNPFMVATRSGEGVFVVPPGAGFPAGNTTFNLFFNIGRVGDDVDVEVLAYRVAQRIQEARA